MLRISHSHKWNNNIMRLGQPLLKVFMMLQFTLLLLPSFSAALTKTTYVEGSISEKSGKVIHLLGGTIWLLSRDSYVLPYTDVLIVMTGNQQGIFFYDGDEIAAKLIDGNPIRESGYYGSVVEQLGEGAILKLDDGSLWSVPSYDRFDTGWWLPPYKIIVTSGLSYMFNLEKGKKIWVSPIKGFNPPTKGIVPGPPSKGKVPSSPRERKLAIEKKYRERKLAQKKNHNLRMCNIYRRYKGRLAVDNMLKRCRKTLGELQCRKCLE
jgi:hypothetical protein